VSLMSAFSLGTEAGANRSASQGLVKELGSPIVSRRIPTVGTLDAQTAQVSRSSSSGSKTRPREYVDPNRDPAFDDSEHGGFDDSQAQPLSVGGRDINSAPFAMPGQATGSGLSDPDRSMLMSSSLDSSHFRVDSSTGGPLAEGSVAAARGRGTGIGTQLYKEQVLATPLAALSADIAAAVSAGSPGHRLYPQIPTVKKNVLLLEPHKQGVGSRQPRKQMQKQRQQQQQQQQQQLPHL
jgi:hypothetical protein